MVVSGSLAVALAVSTAVAGAPTSPGHLVEGEQDHLLDSRTPLEWQERELSLEAGVIYSSLPIALGTGLVATGFREGDPKLASGLFVVGGVHAALGIGILVGFGTALGRHRATLPRGLRLRSWREPTYLVRRRMAISGLFATAGAVLMLSPYVFYYSLPRDGESTLDDEYAWMGPLIAGGAITGFSFIPLFVGAHRLRVYRKSVRDGHPRPEVLPMLGVGSVGLRGSF